MHRLIWITCLLAGTCDGLTGILLVSSPRLTLRWMGIGELPQDLVYLRWIGVFVGAVGLTYLYPLLALWRGKSQAVPWAAARFPVVLETTAIVRLAVAIFVGVSLLSGALTWPWVSVLLTDLGLSVWQLVLLRGNSTHPAPTRTDLSGASR